MLRLEQNRVLDSLRSQTTALLEGPPTDAYGLMGMLRESEYLARDVIGYVGAMVVGAALQQDPSNYQIELFAGPMPDVESVRTHGATPYFTSVHAPLIRCAGSLRYPDGTPISYHTGLVVATRGKGAAVQWHYSDGSAMPLSKSWSANTTALTDAFSAAGLAGEITAADLVSSKYLGLAGFNAGITTPTQALRVAANWWEKTMTPPYDPDAQDHLPRALTPEEAGACLTAQMRDLLAGPPPQRDIDIIRENVPTL